MVGRAPPSVSATWVVQQPWRSDDNHPRVPTLTGLFPVMSCLFNWQLGAPLRWPVHQMHCVWQSANHTGIPSASIRAKNRVKPLPAFIKSWLLKCICDSVHKHQIQNPVGFSRVDLGWTSGLDESGLKLNPSFTAYKPWSPARATCKCTLYGNFAVCEAAHTFQLLNNSVYNNEISIKSYTSVVMPNGVLLSGQRPLCYFFSLIKNKTDVVRHNLHTYTKIQLFGYVVWLLGTGVLPIPVCCFFFFLVWVFYFFNFLF